MVAVQVLEYPVLVFEPAILSWRGFAILHRGHGPSLGRNSCACRSSCRRQRPRGAGSNLRGRLSRWSEDHGDWCADCPGQRGTECRVLSPRECCGGRAPEDDDARIASRRSSLVAKQFAVRLLGIFTTNFILYNILFFHLPGSSQGLRLIQDRCLLDISACE
jgi:hypothetical protein